MLDITHDTLAITSCIEELDALKIDKAMDKQKLLHIKV